MEQLMDYFQKRLSGYKTSIAEDDDVLNDPSSNLKLRVARKLLRIEKVILGNALAAVKEYADELPMNDVPPCRSATAPRLR
eukprot:jgi/Mesen1/2684/ME000167S01831